jgi:chitinase
MRLGILTRLRPKHVALALAVGLISLSSACVSAVYSPPGVLTTSTASMPSPSLTPAILQNLLPATSTTGKLLIGYLSDTSIERGYPTLRLATQPLDVLIYAFAMISPSGECESANPRADAVAFPQLQQLRALKPGLRIALSIGGYGHSGGFSDAALTADSRRQFAHSCVLFMKASGFDGIDIDWEYPVSGGLAGDVHRPEDKANLTSLISEMRRQLDAQAMVDHTRYLLTMAVPAEQSEYSHLELNKIAGIADWLDVMAYAFRTSSSHTTGFDGPLSASAGEKGSADANADAAVRAYLSAGVPDDKLVLGMQLYGRGWKGVADIDHGLFQSVSGPTEGTPGLGGVYSYADLTDNYVGRVPRFWDPEAQEPWLFDAPSGTMITYEDPQPARAKADYVLRNHLLGIAVWQLALDDSRHSLLQALATTFHP